MIGATLEGAFSEAWIAGPRSPSPSAWPPATVVMIPLALTRRMRLLPVSAIRNEPSGRAATSRGAFSEAPVAASPSPPKPALADPATVVMTPVGLTRRMRLLPVSAMRKPPSAVGATPRGPFSRTVPWSRPGRRPRTAGRVAGAGSGDSRDRAGVVDAADAVVGGVGDQVGGVAADEGDVGRRGELRPGGRTPVAGEPGGAGAGDRVDARDGLRDSQAGSDEREQAGDEGDGAERAHRLTVILPTSSESTVSNTARRVSDWRQ